MKNTNIQPTRNTGSKSSPKTNQDFNKKEPQQGDPELKIKSQPSLHGDRNDLLEDETADPGDADGNGNLINEYDDLAIVDKRKKTDEIDGEDLDDEEVPAPDHHVSREDDVKNPDAREI